MAPEVAQYSTISCHILTIDVETEVRLFATYRAGRRVQVPQLIVVLRPFPCDDFRAGLVARLTHVQNQTVEVAHNHEVSPMVRHDESVDGGVISETLSV